MKITRIIAALLCIVFCLGAFAACIPTDNGEATDSTDTTTDTVTDTTDGGETTADTTEETTSTPPEDEESFRVLAIGNSFSEDALEHLYDIATSAGQKNVCVANLYIAGCSLKMHYDNAKGDLKQYIIRYNEEGRKRSVSEYVSIKFALDFRDWDIVVLQQVSSDSGVSSSYEPYISYLADYVRENSKNPDLLLAWHQTWAYQSDSTHGSFPKYDKDQMKMYNAINNCVSKNVIPLNRFNYIIPSGTAIQNVRSSYIGDTLTRDGYHLDYNIGRYIAGLTWYATLTGDSVENVTWKPSNVDDRERLVINEAIKNALEKPLEVTESTYKTAE